MSENKLNSVEQATLPAEGVTLYYEVRGKGPVLLLIAAGGGDATSYADVADYLAEWYTVVTYDRRGYSHSKLNHPDEVPTVEAHGDDAHQILAKLTAEPAYVFGNSAGGVIALDLLTRYPEQIQAVVIHEPARLLSTDPADAQPEDLKSIVERGGMQALQKYIGVDFSARQSVVAGEGAERTENMRFFMEKEPKAMSQYQFNFAGLQEAAAKVRVIVGGSTTAQAAIGYKGAEAAAKFFDTPIIEFPGDHAGYMRYPKEFGDQLHAVFDED